MTTEQNPTIAELRAQTALLATIANQLTRLAQASAPASPNYRRRLSEYSGFDWSEIGAVVAAQDAQGVSEVEWNLHRFTRRAGSGKFGKAIWFSRPTGKDGDENLYARLITFKDSDAEPVPGDVSQASQATTARPQVIKGGKADPQATTIKPTDIYAPTKPANGIAAQITGDPRAEFYRIGGEAVAGGSLDIGVFNGLVDKAKRDGFAVSLQELHTCLRNAVAA